MNSARDNWQLALKETLELARKQLHNTLQTIDSCEEDICHFQSDVAIFDKANTATEVCIAYLLDLHKKGIELPKDVITALHTLGRCADEICIADVIPF